MNLNEFEQLLGLVKKLGEEIELTPEEARAYLLDMSGDEGKKEIRKIRLMELMR